MDKNNELIISESVISGLMPSHSLGKEAVKKICDRLPDLYKGTLAVGRQNSQTTSTLQTMTMLSDSPYRQLKQCLVQIETKRNALLELHFKTKKQKIEIERWEESDDKLDHVKAEETRCAIINMQSAAENTMKEIGIYQDIYDQICESHNIPKDWDEEDFEKTEIDHAIRMGFRQAIQNLLSSNMIAISTAEYWEQFGIHPMIGERLTRQYMDSIKKELDENKFPSVQSMHNFLDSMVETFQNEHKHTLKRIGVDAIINHQYIYKKREKGK